MYLLKDCPLRVGQLKPPQSKLSPMCYAINSIIMQQSTIQHIEHGVLACGDIMRHVGNSSSGGSPTMLAGKWSSSRWFWMPVFRSGTMVWPSSKSFNDFIPWKVLTTLDVSSSQACRALLLSAHSSIHYHHHPSSPHHHHHHGYWCCAVCPLQSPPHPLHLQAQQDLCPASQSSSHQTSTRETLLPGLWHGESTVFGSRCYSQLPGQSRFLDMHVLLSLSPFRTRLVHRGLIYLLPRSLFLCFQAHSLGRPDPCSCFTFCILSGVGFIFWLLSWLLQTACLL